MACPDVAVVRSFVMVAVPRMSRGIFSVNKHWARELLLRKDDGGKLDSEGYSGRMPRSCLIATRTSLCCSR